MSTPDRPELRVAPPIATQPATFGATNATDDATDAEPSALKAAAMLVLGRNRPRNQDATTTQKVAQLEAPKTPPKVALANSNMEAESAPDQKAEICAEIWRLYLDSGDQIDAIRGRPMTLAEVLAEFPGERVVAAEPRLPKGESIKVWEDKTWQRPCGR
jgi:hypothetical protein